MSGMEIVEETEVTCNSHQEDENVEDQARDELRLVAENDKLIFFPSCSIIFTCSFTAHSLIMIVICNLAS